MIRDMLLVRACQFFVALPADRLLEIIDMKTAVAQDPGEGFSHAIQTDEENSISQAYRIWRNQVLPVMHFGHFLDYNNPIQYCRYTLVYQSNPEDIIFIDVDKIYHIIHLNTQKQKAIRNPHKELLKFSSHMYEVPSLNVLAYLLDEDLDLLEENKKVLQIDLNQFNYESLTVQSCDPHPSIPHINQQSKLPNSLDSIKKTVKPKKPRKRKKEPLPDPAS